MSGALVDSRFPLAPLGYAAEVTLGKMVQTSPTPRSSAVPYIKAKNVRPTKVDLSELDQMYATAKEQITLTVQVGDVFVIEGGATAGRAAVVTDVPPDGCIFQNAVHRIRARSGLDQRYLYYVLAMYPATGWYDAVCSAATFKHLTREKMAELPIPLPPVETQRRIADMLDTETARIDTLVDKNFRAAQLTRLRHGEFIATAVTMGLAEAPSRPTELRWAPAINRSWPIVPYQFLARTGSGHTPSRNEPSYWIACDIPWVTTSDVGQLREGRAETLADTTHKISAVGMANSSARLHPAGTVFLSRTASVGFSAIMGQDMATSQDFFTWTCGPQVQPAYLLHVLRAMKVRGLFDLLMYGSTHKTIYVPDLMQLRGPLPPHAEQADIVREIRAHGDSAFSAIDAMKRQEQLLVERRRALITAAVTGQIDV